MKDLLGAAISYSA